MAEKARIVVYDDKNKEQRSKQITVMFNPNEYTIVAEAKYSGEDNNIQFIGTEVPEFKVSLFFDTYESKMDVRQETKKIFALMVPSVAGKKTKRPPVCGFVWGKYLYRGIITNLEQRFTMFLPNGVPVRAVADVTFKSKEIFKKAEDLKGLEACRKLWMVKSGDRIDLIANEALKDPKAWRRIAIINKIDNPMEFPNNSDIGRTLIIPD